MRLLRLLAAPLVLAGCMGGGHATPRVPRVYEAHLTFGGVERTVWLDIAGGRFRVGTPAGHSRIVAVSDGRTAVTKLRGLTTRTTGSAGFLVTTVDPAVRTLRDRLLGRSVPAAATITGLHRIRRPGAGLFAVAGVAAPNQVVREVRVGVAPQTGPSATGSARRSGGSRQATPRS